MSFYRERCIRSVPHLYSDRERVFARARVRKYHCSKPDRCRRTRINQLIRQPRLLAHSYRGVSPCAHRGTRITRITRSPAAARVEPAGKPCKTVAGSHWRRVGEWTRWRDGVRGRGVQGAKERLDDDNDDDDGGG